MTDVMRCIDGFSVAPDGMESLNKKYLKKENAAHEAIGKAFETAREKIQTAIDNDDDVEAVRVQADVRIKETQAELARIRRKERPKIKGRLKTYRRGHN